MKIRVKINTPQDALSIYHENFDFFGIQNLSKKTDIIEGKVLNRWFLIVGSHTKTLYSAPGGY